MARKLKVKENYLDYIPIRNPEFTWKRNKAGIIVVEVVHNGIYDKVAQKLFRRPKISHIKLDEYGSYIWEIIDDEHDMGYISQKIKEKFGDKAEPLYDRLIKYFQILQLHKFVRLQKPE